MRIIDLEANLIVVAVYDGQTEPARNSGEKVYRFGQGQVGVLSWAIVDYFNYEPRVTWDDDSERLPRRVLPNNFRAIGIETEGYRFICTKPRIEVAGHQFLSNNFAVMKST